MMDEFFEIDFLDVESKKSGDAIPLRYRLDGDDYIHVTDGGFEKTGKTLVKHINEYYGQPGYLDAVIVSHPDGDHACGLRALFKEFEIGGLWMLRPWLYADDLIDRFSRFTSVENLIRRLKELYPHLTALEELADKHKVPIREPFQGEQIERFTVLAPTKATYLDHVVESDKTPEATKMAEASSVLQMLERVRNGIVTLVKSAWGVEVFPAEDTSHENNMSIVQYAELCGKRVLLTADAGRAALEEAADYAPNVGLCLPGIDRIQIPHHGSRHNVSTKLLDRWLGPKFENQPTDGKWTFSAVVSAAKADKDHPRKSVVRALIHRGGAVTKTKGSSICMCDGTCPPREGWSTATPEAYPEVQEEL